MKTLFHTLAIGFCTLFALSAVGQNVHYHCKDGKLFFKIKNQSDLIIDDVSAILAKGTPTEISDLIEQYDITSIKRSFSHLNTPIFDRTYEVFFNQHSGVDALVASLQKLPYIEYAERAPLYRISYTPNDPLIGNQYSLTNISAYDAWDLHQGGNSTVAVIDNAILTTHLDLRNNMWENPGEIPGNNIDDDGNGYVDDIKGWDVADNDNNPDPPSSATNSVFSHGSHCSGIAAGQADNNTGIASIGFNTRLIAVKGTGNNSSHLFIDNGEGGMAYAIAAKADVISMSYGSESFSQTGQNLMNEAASEGIICVAAAGNSNSSTEHYPAAYQNVIAVAGTVQSDVRLNISNFGSWVDIAAPGGSVYSCLAGSNNSYGNQTGTSMAAPMVAGLCALMKSYKPDATAAEIELCLKSSADNIDAQNPGFIGQLGAGRINAFLALECITPRIAPVVAFSGMDNACEFETIQFTDSSDFQPDTWQWSFPGGVPSTSNLADPIVTYPSAGTYDVTLIASNLYGADTLTMPSFVTITSGGNCTPNVAAQPSAAFTTNIQTGCAPQTVTFTDLSLGVPSAWNWTFTGGDITSSSDQNPVVTYNMAGVYPVTLEVSNTFGTDTRTITNYINVYDAPVANFTHAVNSATVSFTNTSQNGNDYRWDFGDGGSFSNLENPIHTYDVLGTYTVTLTVTNECASVAYTQVVTTAPLAGYTASVSVGCAPLTVAFADDSQGDITSWNWSFLGGNPSTSTDPNPTVTFPSVGTFLVSLNVINASGQSASNGFVVTYDVPIAGFSYVATDSLVNFTNDNTGGAGLAHGWDFGDGITSNDANPTHIYANDGVYTITLTTTTPCGTDVTTDVITIGNPVSTNDIDNTPQLSIYPNPTNGQVALMLTDINTTEAISVEVINTLGQVVMQEQYSVSGRQFSNAIDLSDQSTGVYFVQLRIGEQTISKRIIKQ